MPSFLRITSQRLNYSMIEFLNTGTITISKIESNPFIVESNFKLLTRIMIFLIMYNFYTTSYLIK